MKINDTKKQTRQLFIAVVVYIIIAVALMAPVLLVAVKWPDYIWFVAGPSLFVDLAGIVVLFVLANRLGKFDTDSPIWKPSAFALAGITALTGGFIAGAFIWPEWIFVNLALYIVVMLLGVFLSNFWASKNLAFNCDECRETFRANIMTWVFSPNMGSRKYVKCPKCGHRCVARIIKP